MKYDRELSTQKHISNWYCSKIGITHFWHTIVFMSVSLSNMYQNDNPVLFNIIAHRSDNPVITDSILIDGGRSSTRYLRCSSCCR